ncbi:hypothetical protein [Acetobacterium carbinolicum]|uniref:hypothetical protein n=1 Tax=Acetobacterium carbinolicum TaxID=52690 RepID=UPI0039C8F131
MDKIIPLIICSVGIIALIVMNFWNKKNKTVQFKRKKKEPEQNSVHDFINVKDIKGYFLYTKDNKICAYYQMDAISLELLSQNEKRALCKQLCVQMAPESAWRFLSVERPVDIFPLVEEYSRIWTQTTEPVVKDILGKEMLEMHHFAESGEIVQRQYYFIVWEEYEADIERDFLKRITDIESRLASATINGEILKQQEIVRLCNLINNPAYCHLEDMEYGNQITTIMDLYKNSHESQFMAADQTQEVAYA